MLQAGQQIGPFTVERELGAGAMGAVYRGVYQPAGGKPPVKVALKIMLPGAAENKTTASRFDREIQILKQLNHPNIVRIVGSGTHHGQRYYAMEYIQGESLDRVLLRRGRMSWEEVVQLGQQLCAALSHAHEKGVVHRDLKPSNLMILPDGTLKLTDFGIAKDLDVTQLTEANCTVGTASYMSPEQCRGERDLTFKSDLYSLGVVLYELVTGKKPFLADNVLEMFTLHVKGVPERPSRLVDIPKWLDTLICQLLEKKPEQRPRDAAMVAEVLADVLEKVEARQSAGVEAARKRRPGEPRDEADREATNALNEGKKKKKKKKPERVPWYTRTWVKAVGLLLPLLGVVFALWLVFRPPSADKLYSRIEKLMTSADPRDHVRAHKGLIREYLRRYGGGKDEKTRQVLAWDEQVGLRLEEEDLLPTAERTKTFGDKWEEKMDALKPAQRKAVKAVLAENEGDLAKARAAWQLLVDEHGSDGGDWTKLAQRRLAFQLDSVKDRTAQLDRHFVYMDEFVREANVTDNVEKAAFTARRFEAVGDLHAARLRWDELKKELKTRPEVELRSWFLLASSRAAALEQAKPPSEPQARADRVKGYLEAARKEFEKERKFSPVQAKCLHVLALYEKEDVHKKEFGPLVEEANKLLADIKKASGEK
jgi:eukaryotic-like serine/threonine-protein kinase